METATPDFEVPSCWDEDYWLRNCEGFRVWDGAEPIGYVDTVLLTRSRRPHSLIVSVGTTFTHLLSIGIDAVQGIDPERERVFVALTARPRAEPRQLPIPAFVGDC